MPGQRQRRQPQPGRPALGPLIQQPERRIGQRYPGRFEQRPRLLEGEAQVGRADLGQLPRQPQPVQAQPQVMAGGEDEPQPRWRAHEQQFQLAERLGRAQLVQVVDHQPDPVLQAAEIGQQPFDNRPAVQTWSRRQRPDQLRPGGRAPQRGEYRQPEPLRVAFFALHRHPRRPLRQVRIADPGAKQERFPTPGRRRHHGPAPGLGEQAEEPGPGDDSGPDRRSSRRAGPQPAGRHPGRFIRPGAKSPGGVTPAHPAGREAYGQRRPRGTEPLLTSSIVLKSLHAAIWMNLAITGARRRALASGRPVSQ